MTNQEFEQKFGLIADGLVSAMIDGKMYERINDEIFETSIPRVYIMPKNIPFALYNRLFSESECLHNANSILKN